MQRGCVLHKRRLATTRRPRLPRAAPVHLGENGTPALKHFPACQKQRRRLCHTFPTHQPACPPVAALLPQAIIFEEIATMDYPYEGIPTIPPRKDMDHMAFFCSGCRYRVTAYPDWQARQRAGGRASGPAGCGMRDRQGKPTTVWAARF